MAKTEVSQWSATASDNADIGGINIAEGCAPGNLNDALREMMAQLAVLNFFEFGDAGIGGSSPATVPNDDLDDITLTGVYACDAPTSNKPSRISNGLVLHMARTATIHAQICLSRESDDIAWRYKSNVSGVWSSWFEVWHTNRMGSGTGLDADTVDGVEAADLASRVLDARGVTTGYTVVDDDLNRRVQMNTDGGTLNLPAAATIADGGWFIADVNASHTSNMTIQPNGAETINGAASYSLRPGEQVIVQREGSAWKALFEPGIESADRLVAVMTDLKASGTSGQTHSASTWTAHDLNTININIDSAVSLGGSGQFTVTNAGHVKTQVLQRDNHTHRLYNVTESAVAAGTAMGAGVTGGGRAHSSGRWQVEAGKTYRVEFYHSTSTPVTGLSLAGVSERYCLVEVFA